MKTLARASVTVFAFLASTVNIYMLVFMYDREANGTNPLQPSNFRQQRFSKAAVDPIVNNYSPYQNQMRNEEPIQWSGILDFFPDLRNVSQNELEPIVLTTRSRIRKKLMIGIPVAERERDYTIETLDSLLQKLDDDYRKDIVFLVMFATKNMEFIQDKTRNLREKFSNEIDNGYLEIIAVAPAWYNTDIGSIPPTFNDGPERMFWRTKQNIDYIYIMTYASQRCDYYMQLEDDVEAATGYAVIFNYLALKDGTQWFFMSFSSMGFIGKLFSAFNLKYMTYAVALYYRFKPVDWILEDILRSRYCSLDKNMQECTKAISSNRISSGASQFQHIGKISSLKGKIQKIHDATFSKGLSQGKRGNPSANVTTSMTPVKRHDAQTGYNNNVAMWFINPKIGDYVSIAFDKPINITGVMFLSGVPPAPQDKLGLEAVVNAYSGTTSEINIGQFSRNGDFVFRSSGIIVSELRIKITADINHWVTIDHIIIDAKDASELIRTNITHSNT